MDNSNFPDQAESDLNEWEQIQSPAVERDMVAIRESYLRDSLSFYPPVVQNETPQAIPSPDEPIPNSRSSSSSTTSSDGNSSQRDGSGSELERTRRSVDGVGKCLGLRLRVLGSEIARIAGKVRYCAVCVGGLRSFQAVTGVLAAVLVALVYARLRKWRRRIEEENRSLIFMIKEKDQKINRLLIQLAQMNESLSFPRKVPVFRINLSHP